jgi:hypothetical protein
MSKPGETEQADRDRPLRDLQLQSVRAGFAEGDVLVEAADNLLDKALRDLVQGNSNRAEAYIDRAARLPVSAFHEMEAGRISAHLMLFSAVTDEAEDSGPGESEWLDAALTTLEQCGELAALDLKILLKATAMDYELSPAEKKRISAVVGEQDHDAVLEDLLSSGRASVKDLIRQDLEAIVLYDAALEAAYG